MSIYANNINICLVGYMKSKFEYCMNLRKLNQAAIYNLVHLHKSKKNSFKSWCCAIFDLWVWFMVYFIVLLFYGVFYGYSPTKTANSFYSTITQHFGLT